MNDDRLTLRQIAQRASKRHDGAAGRAIDRVAKKAGLTLSYTTFDRILAGTYTSTPSRETLEALSELANVPIDDVRRAAGLPIPMGSFAEQLPPDVDLLSGAQRESVIAVVRQFVAANKALHERVEVMGNAEQHPAPIVLPVARPEPKRKAARKGGASQHDREAVAEEGRRRRQRRKDANPPADEDTA